MPLAIHRLPIRQFVIVSIAVIAEPAMFNDQSPRILAGGITAIPPFGRAPYCL